MCNIFAGEFKKIERFLKAKTPNKKPKQLGGAPQLFFFFLLKGNHMKEKKFGEKRRFSGGLKIAGGLFGGLLLYFIDANFIFLF